MKEYLKILISTTIIVFSCGAIVGLFFENKISLFDTSIAALLSGIVLAFVLKRI